MPRNVARRTLLLAAAVALTASATVACGADGDGAAAKPGRTTVRIAYQAIPNADLIVKNQKLLEKALPEADVKWVKFESGGDVNTAVIAGSVDLGLAGSSPVTKGLSAPLNIPYKVVWIHDLIGDNEALVAKSGIDSVKDLAGKKVATPFGSTSHYSLLAALKDRIAELLDRVGLPGMAGRRTWELSGGQQQRVALARALAAEPELLLMDEPFAALDALTRERLQEEVRSLAGRLGTTVLFVTHSVEEAVLLGSRVLVMAAGPGGGRVVEDLPVPLPRDPETDVAGLRACPEFARLRGRLARALRPD